MQVDCYVSNVCGGMLHVVLSDGPLVSSFCVATVPLC
jgi:hypothetical protein